MLLGSKLLLQALCGTDPGAQGREAGERGREGQARDRLRQGKQEKGEDKKGGSPRINDENLLRAKNE